MPSRRRADIAGAPLTAASNCAPSIRHTVDGHRARTVAFRGALWMSPTSPNQSPWVEHPDPVRPVVVGAEHVEATPLDHVEVLGRIALAHHLRTDRHLLSRTDQRELLEDRAARLLEQGHGLEQPEHRADPLEERDGLAVGGEQTPGGQQARGPAPRA